MSSVLVGITSKNRKEILPKAIKSALDQVSVERSVAVFDDASTDGTNELAVDFPSIEWHFSREPRGYLYARNMFLEKTASRYYCSLDDDSWLLDRLDLNRAVKYLDENLSVGALAFKILTPDSPEKGELNSIGDGDAITTNNFIGCGHIIRVQAAREVGLYAENPGYYGGEEKDMCIRLMNAGYSIKFFPTVTVWHDKTMLSRDVNKQHRSGVCNDLVFAYRRTPGVLLLPVIVFKIFSHLRFSVFYKKELLLMAGIHGIGDFFKFFFSRRLNRKAVSMKTYKSFQQLYKIQSAC